MIDSKNWLISRTLWAAVLNVAIAHLSPEIRQFIADNPEVYASLVSLGVAVLRFLTTKGLGA